MAKVELKVNGAKYEGWETVTVQKSIEAAAGGFMLSVHDTKETWPIQTNDKCELVLEGKTVITGYVDKVDIGVAGKTHSISVSGRDAAGDLVDCSVEYKSAEFTNQTLLQIATTICAPFGVKVAAKTSIGAAFPKFAIQPGETVWQAMDRMARQRGVLIISDGKGGIEFIQPGGTDSGVSIVEGQNMLSGSASFDVQERYSRYVVKGQTVGTDDAFGSTAAQIAATATDPNVNRYRPLVVISEGNTDAGQAKTRAEFEASTRAARSGVFTIDVQGWQKNDEGALWLPNELVTCKVPSLYLDGKMLVSSVDYTQSINGGTTAKLKLARADAFRAIAIPPKKGGKGDKSAGNFSELFG